ncbi:MAG TPA: VOC family protein [Polyangia bacterium]|jgi:catechol 2,3-dioxygenase-like lactoylglutathione lyase family enzyme|nr:VOC family protein [Polyangia bacterium]
MLKLSLNIDVDDLDQGVAFYDGALGLAPVRRLGDFAVELAGAQVPVYLLLKPSSSPPFRGASFSRRYDRHWTPVHVDFVVDDIAPALARAVNAGARAESEIETYDWGRLALLADPFGNGFCLIALDGAGYDAIARPYGAAGG